MLFMIEERRGGLIYDFGFGGSGWGYTGEGDKYIHYAKKGVILWKCFNTFVPHCLNVKSYYYTQVEHCVTVWHCDNDINWS